MALATRRDPAQNAFAVTPSDTTVISTTRALYVGAAGNVAVLMNGDTSAVTFVGCQTGQILPLAVTKVMSTNTTATSIVGIY